MRIRGGRISSAPDRGHHASPSTSSSSSSITAATAPSSTSLVSSSQDSSNSFSFSLLEAATTTTASPHRCRGLDLLVKAIHQVTAGSVIGVPYIQRRVTIRRRRRRRGFQFDGVVLTEILGHHSGDKGQQNEKKLKAKQTKGKSSSSASKPRQRRGIRIPI